MCEDGKIIEADIPKMTSVPVPKETVSGDCIKMFILFLKP